MTIMHVALSVIVPSVMILALAVDLAVLAHQEAMAMTDDDDDRHVPGTGKWRQPAVRGHR